MKVWEVKFSRSGDFEKAARAFDLTGAVSIDLLSMFKNCCSGHRSGVYSFAFSADSGKMATVLFSFSRGSMDICTKVSKDGSWKVFDTAIQFSRGHDAEVNSGNA